MLTAILSSEEFRGILLDLILLLISLAAGYTTRWLNQRTKTDKALNVESTLRTKKEYALLAVKFVEQAYRTYGNKDKLYLATDWLKLRGKSLGIEFTPQELKGLIEAALKEFKTEINKLP